MQEKRNAYKVIIICAIAMGICVASIVLIWISNQAYLYYNPNLEIYVWTREGEDLYWEHPSYATWGDSAFGISPEVYDNIKEFAEETARVDEELHTFQKPIDITCEVVIQGNQTIVTYEGTATNRDGVTENIYEQLVFDFIITEDIIDHSLR